MKKKLTGHCAWCLRKLDRIGICADCAAIIRASFKLPVFKLKKRHP